MQLKKRVLTASIWTIGNNIAAHGLRLISNLILTRLLAPEMFGLMSIISAMLMGIFMLTDVGLNVNVVQSKRADIEYLNTIWSLGIVRALFIWILSILAALGLYVAQSLNLLPLNTVYTEPMLPYVIPVFSLSVVIGAFEPSWTAMDRRNFYQARLVKVGVVSNVIGVIFMVTLAWFNRSIWALVIGSLGSSIARALIVNFYIKSQKNHFYIEKEAMHSIFHFGKWIFLSSLIGFFANTSDQFMLGGYVTAKQLGVYNIAAVIIGAIAMSMLSILNRVAYPALSETIRNKPYDLKRVYYRFRMPFDLGALFLAGFFYVAGSQVINILYDDRYLDAGWIIGILSIGLLTIRYQVSNQCIMALGHAKQLTLYSVIKALSIFVFLPIGYRYNGLEGAVWALTLTGFASFPLSLYHKKKYGILDVEKEFITLPMILVGMMAGWVFNQAIGPFMHSWS